MGAKKGDKVSIEYEGRLENGEIFDSTKHGDHSHPLEFTLGSGEVIAGFETAVSGMEEEEEKEFSIEPQDAYGFSDPNMKKEIPRNALPQDRTPEVGMMLMLGTPSGERFPARIDAVNDKTIVIDMNHPLAGKKLFFKIKVLSITPTGEVYDKGESVKGKKKKIV